MRETPTTAWRRGEGEERKRQRNYPVRERASKGNWDQKQQRYSTKESKRDWEYNVTHAAHSSTQRHTGGHAVTKRLFPPIHIQNLNALSFVGKRNTFWVGDCCLESVFAVFHISDWTAANTSIKMHLNRLAKCWHTIVRRSGRSFFESLNKTKELYNHRKVRIPRFLVPIFKRAIIVHQQISVSNGSYTHGSVITQNRQWKSLFLATTSKIVIRHHHHMLLQTNTSYFSLPGLPLVTLKFKTRGDLFENTLSPLQVQIYNLTLWL